MLLVHSCCFFFFFQAEDGIRDGHVTGVQTCALPISSFRRARDAAAPRIHAHGGMMAFDGEKMSKSLGNLVLVSKLRAEEIGRASCRERVWVAGAGVGA